MSESKLAADIQAMLTRRGLDCNKPGDKDYPLVVELIAYVLAVKKEQRKELLAAETKLAAYLSKQNRG